jgi:uracil-DNA glycosylase
MRTPVFLLVLRDLLDQRWRELLQPSLPFLDQLETELDFSINVPQMGSIFRAFDLAPQDVKVVIFGQDPYPNPEHAMGLSFSTPASVRRIPASLKNIYREMLSDVGGTEPENGDLTYLAEQGVMLLNRGLSISTIDHKVNPLWYAFTDQVASQLASMNVVGIFWGNQAQELAHHFSRERRICGVHPSPLSAYRGFFGSKPFSQVNRILAEQNRPIIEWTKK